MASIAQRIATRFRVAKTFLMKDPQQALKGETIEVVKLPEYEAEVKRLAAEYKKQKVQLDRLPSGRAKGMAGRDLAQLGDEGRKARARVEVAKRMQSHGLTKAKF